MKSFLLKISIATLIMAAAGGIIFKLIMPGFYEPAFLLVLLICFVFTIIIHGWQIKAIRKGFVHFAKTNMIVTVSRLFFYAAIVIIYLIFNQENITAFIVVVAILYLVYNVLETKELTGFSKQLAKENPD
jgi:O-antigen/teichoic acid export membrane protein